MEKKTETMSIETFICLLSKKNPHLEISDNFVKNGYGQLRGGYIENAKKEGIALDVKNAEPNQNWHLCVNYRNIKYNPNEDASVLWGRRYLRCPELLLWILEASGICKTKVNELADEAKSIIDDKKVRRARENAANAIRQKISFEEVVAALLQK
ncbi:MAG TPA: hypothetical protein VGC17_01305 [Lactovum miscens]|uniref:hypothetical protein n=1 Tax=Lactovum miscens TaxID=190387 RepID=UPI002ED86E72